jgi:hypothetical protein
MAPMTFLLHVITELQTAAAIKEFVTAIFESCGKSDATRSLMAADR